jgi:hypothetical protein
MLWLEWDSILDRAPWIGPVLGAVHTFVLIVVVASAVLVVAMVAIGIPLTKAVSRLQKRFRLSDSVCESIVTIPVVTGGFLLSCYLIAVLGI